MKTDIHREMNQQKTKTKTKQSKISTLTQRDGLNGANVASLSFTQPVSASERTAVKLLMMLARVSAEAPLLPDRSSLMRPGVGRA